MEIRSFDPLTASSEWEDYAPYVERLEALTREAEQLELPIQEAARR